MEISGQTVGITCKKWVEEFKRKDRSSWFEVVNTEDIKCLHGRNNLLKNNRRDICFCWLVGIFGSDENKRKVW